MYPACSTAPADAVLPDRNVDAMIFEMVDYMFHRRQSTSVTIWSRTVVAMSEMGMSYLDVNAMHSTNVIDNIFLLCSMGRAKTAIALVCCHLERCQLYWSVCCVTMKSRVLKKASYLRVRQRALPRERSKVQWMRVLKDISFRNSKRQRCQ